MRIKNRYCAKLSPALLSALNERKIAYETFSMCNSPYIIFYLYDDDFDKEKIESCLNDINAIILPEMVFSKSEYENANWYCFIAKHDKISQCDNDQTYSFFARKKMEGLITFPHISTKLDIID